MCRGKKSPIRETRQSLICNVHTGLVLFVSQYYFSCLTSLRLIKKITSGQCILGCFGYTFGGAQNHLQMKMQGCLALTPWGHGHRPLSWWSVKQPGSFPLPPRPWPASISTPPRGRKRSEVASCSSPSKQQRNSLD